MSNLHLLAEQYEATAKALRAMADHVQSEKECTAPTLEEFKRSGELFLGSDGHGEAEFFQYTGYGALTKRDLMNKLAKGPVLPPKYIARIGRFHAVEVQP